jgi:Mrp family chromosome partitioning ATPase
VGDFAEAFRRAEIDGRGTGSEERRAAASAPAPPPDWVPIPDPQDDEEGAYDASLTPWRQEAIAEEPSEEEAEPLEIPRSEYSFFLSPGEAGRFWRGRAIRLEKPETVASCFHHFALRVRKELEQRETGTVLITSPLRREGKTVTACNLAVALASMAPGRRIALLDLDLRSPSVFAAMGVMPLVGVEDVLAERAPLDSACIRMEGASLDLLPATNPVPDAHELLASSALPALFRELAKRYETVVCDVPPVLPVPDVPLILPHVGAWVAVARAGLTRRSAFSDMLDLLTEQKLIGSFLNCAPAPRHAEREMSHPDVGEC